MKAHVPVMPWGFLQWWALVHFSNLSLLSLPTRSWKVVPLPRSGRLMWHRWGLGQPWSICLGSLRKKVFTSKGNPCLTGSRGLGFQKSSQHSIGPCILPRQPLQVTLQLYPTVDLYWQYPRVPPFGRSDQICMWLSPARGRKWRRKWCEVMGDHALPLWLPCHKELQANIVLLSRFVHWAQKGKKEIILWIAHGREIKESLADCCLIFLVGQTLSPVELGPILQAPPVSS